MNSKAQSVLSDNATTDVWIASLDLAGNRLAELKTYLSADEQARCSRFVIPAIRDRFISARGQLREILASYLCCLPIEIAFRYGLHGKPELAHAHAELHFNLSHSGVFALVAVNRHHAIGIDIELCRGGRHFLKLADRFFSPREAAELHSLPEQMQQDAFYACWTRKEAYLKAIGTGLATPLNAFDVTLLPGVPPALSAHRLTPEETDRWQVIDLSVPAGYRGALVDCKSASTPVVRNWPLP